MKFNKNDMILLCSNDNNIEIEEMDQIDKLKKEFYLVNN